MFEDSKKAIATIISISLLLVVSVSSVLYFSTWFESFSSDVISDLENNDYSLKDEVVINDFSDSNLYLSHVDVNLNISEIIINDVSCSGVSGVYSKGISKFNLASCIFSSGDGVVSLMVITDKGILSKTLVVSCGGVCALLNVSVSNLNPAVSESVSFSLDYLVANSPEVEGLLWKSSDIGVASGFARFADLDGDSKKTNLIIGNSGYIDKIVVFNSDGVNIWNKSGNNGMVGGIGIIDYDLDGRDDIVMAGDTYSDLRLINNSGGEVWRDTVTSGSIGAVNFFDLDGDGKKEIITGNSSNFLIYNSNGTKFFPFSIPSIGLPFEIDFGDFNSDGVIDHILFLTFGPGNLILLQTMNFSGDLIWNSSNILDRSGYSGFGLSTFDFDSSGFDNYVVASENGMINIFNSTGGHILSKSNGGVTIPEVLAFDFEGSGFNDDLIVSSNSGVYRYNKSLDLVWFFDSPNSVYSVRVGDVIGDLKNELVVLDVSGFVFILDLSDGSEILNFSLGLSASPQIYGDSPTLDLSDVNSDGVLDIGVALAAGYGMVLQVIDCEVEFSDGIFQMNWDESLGKFSVDRIFLIPGTYEYDVVCERKGFKNLVYSSEIIVS